MLPMRLGGKLAWRVDLLRSKVRGTEVLGWGAVFRKLLYEEVYGRRGCIYQLPGKVEVRPGAWVIDGDACEGLFTLYCLGGGEERTRSRPWCGSWA